MKILELMNSDKNWENKIKKSPYNIEVKWDGCYCILKYDMIRSDFNLDEVKEARGSIFKLIDNEWKCVCRAMDKFGNFSESYAATPKINWEYSVSIQEKLDGSLIKLWCDNGLWNVSTNGSINAFTASCGDSTFGDVFYSIVQEHTTIRNFFSYLNPTYTYWFELVHPIYNPIVVRYKEAAIYYLGCRNMETMEESEICATTLGKDRNILDEFKWVKVPHKFEYSTLDECLEAAHKMGEDEEGYVVCAYRQMENDSFLRIKVKGNEYLKRHKLRGNGPLTVVRIISLWQQDILDDFVAYFPENIPLVEETIEKIKDLCEKADIVYDTIKGWYKKRSEFAFHVESYVKPIRSYLFARLDNKVDCASTYFKQVKAKNLAELIDIKNIKM